jgi:predicted transcriptional regulator
MCSIEINVDEMSVHELQCNFKLLSNSASSGNGGSMSPRTPGKTMRTVEFEDEQLGALQKIADEQDRPLSQIIRFACAAYLKNYEAVRAGTRLRENAKVARYGTNPELFAAVDPVTNGLKSPFYATAAEAIAFLEGELAAKLVAGWPKKEEEDQS